MDESKSGGGGNVKINRSCEVIVIIYVPQVYCTSTRGSVVGSVTTMAFGCFYYYVCIRETVVIPYEGNPHENTMYGVIYTKTSRVNLHISGIISKRCRHSRITRHR